MREIDQVGLQANLLCLLDALALGGALRAHIANGGKRVELAIEQQGVQADFHREFRAILAPPDEIQPYAHRASMWIGEIALQVPGVGRVKAPGKEQFERLPRQLGARIAKECPGLPIHQRDDPGRVDDHQRIRRDVQKRKDVVG